MRRWWTLIVTLVLAAGFAALLAPPASAQLGAVAGTVTYGGSVKPGSDAVLLVGLMDVDTGATLSEMRMPNPGQPPINFALSYDPSKIDRQHTYSVAAQIFEGGWVTYQTTKLYPVITKGNPMTADLVLTKFDDSSASSGTVTVVISYNEQLKLTGAAVVAARLMDVTAGTTLDQQSKTNPGQVPILMALHYDPTKIDPTHIYAVFAQILEGERLIFQSTGLNRVITDAPNQVNLLLTRAGLASGPAGSTRTVLQPKTGAGDSGALPWLLLAGALLILGGLLARLVVLRTQARQTHSPFGEGGR